MINQIAIFIFSSGAIYLVGRTDKWKRWGYIFGLLSQPFWFYMSFQTQQWGVFFMCFVYTFSWINGFRNYWIKKPKREKILRQIIKDDEQSGMYDI